MPGLLSLFAALLVLSSAEHIPTRSWSFFAAAIPLALATWLAIALVAMRVLRALPDTDEQGHWRRLSLVDASAQLLLLGAWAYLCLGWGWPLRSGSYCLGILPYVLAQFLWLWAVLPRSSIADASGRCTLGMRTLAVLHRLRLGMVPLAVLLPVYDIATLIIQHTVVGAWLAERDLQNTANFIGALLMAVVMVAVIPGLLVRLWGAQQLPQDDLAEQLASACQRLGVRTAGLLRWPVPAGKMYNAALIGVIPRLRYVLFTDDLLRDLDRRQLLAVLGHELGHARHRHLWTYLVFALGTMAVTELVLRLPQTAHLLHAALPNIDLTTAELVARLLLLVLLWRFAFGYLSRLCERQADLVGAELVGDPVAMQDALRSVAQLSGQPEHAPSWRHHSIRERIDFLERVRRDPALVSAHHRLVQSVRTALLVFVAIMSLLLVASWWFDPIRRAATSTDPAAMLSAQADKDAGLAAALAAADLGDAAPFAGWLAGADAATRQSIAALHLRLAGAFDDPALPPSHAYELRHRLRAFQAVSTSEPRLDTSLDNVLAYAIAAGGPAAALPVEDTALLRALLPRLDRALRSKEDAGLWDTIGCVHFRLGDWQKAKEAFTQAETLLKKQPQSKASEQQRLLETFRRRAQATLTNLSGGSELLPAEVPAPNARPAATFSQRARPATSAHRPAASSSAAINP